MLRLASYPLLPIFNATPALLHTMSLVENATPAQTTDADSTMEKRMRFNDASEPIVLKVGGTQECLYDFRRSACLFVRR